MKVIHLNATTKEVSEVEHDGTLESIYSLIGCDYFTTAYLPNGDCLYVDDEGLLKLHPLSPMFLFDGFPQPLAGNAMLVGTSPEGDTISPKTTLEEAKQKASFFLLEQGRALGLF